MAAGGRIPVRHPGTPGPRGGGGFVSELQRTRLLEAAFAVVCEEGYKRMTARRVSARAGMSSKTFYDLFSDREDCFLAAFDYAVEELAAIVIPAYESEGEWAARVREGLGTLLALLDRERELRQLVFVEALGAGPRVLARRAQVLQELGGVIDGGRAGVQAGRELPPLTAEGLVGAAFGVIYGRLLEDQDAELAGLSNALMATIVLPYRGHTAAARELSRRYRAPLLGSSRVRGGASVRPAGIADLNFRVTVRTQMVLAAVAELNGREASPSNRQVADAAEITDQGQISRLLRRLEGHGLIQNTGGQTQGAPNAWQLTDKGRQITQTFRAHAHNNREVAS